MEKAPDLCYNTLSDHETGEREGQPMRFLHLADLHLGKMLHGVSLLENGDQGDWVEKLLRAVEENPPDAVLTETEEAMSALGELSGRTVRADITDRIFERFCVGK